jgi:hypothetical protein
MADAPVESPTAVECRTFARYLCGANPTEYVASAYSRLLPSAAVSAETAGLLIERSLLAFARLGSPAIRIADGYAGVFRPRSALRRRLVLLLAILENSPPTARTLNTGDEGTAVAVVARLAATLVVSGVCALIGVLVLGPVHVVSNAMSKDASRKRAAR